MPVTSRLPTLVARIAGALCATAAVAAATAATPPLAPGMYLADAVTTRPALAASYTRLTQDVSDVEWLRGYGVASPAEAVEVDGVNWLVFMACKPHDCPSETYTLLVHPDKGEFVAGAFVRNVSDGSSMRRSEITWLGEVEQDTAAVIGGFLF